MRRPLVAGNWKMHGLQAGIADLVKGLQNQTLPAAIDVAVMPSFPYISQVIESLKGKAIEIGAQTCSTEAGQGAMTGEVSPSQIRDIGCTMVLVGHSERRQFLAETNDVVVRKFAAAQACDLIPVLCIGETREERESGRTLTVVGEQLGCVIDALGCDALSRAVIAYEPVWAIGTGLTATSEQAQEVHAAIRAQIAAADADIAQKVRILYGGSVKMGNAGELFAMPDIDGGLIGGASLNAEEFGAICRAAGS